MSVNSKMTALADEIRILSGTTDTMGLDVMATHVGDANDEVDSQTVLIAQIASALEGKAGKNREELPYVTGIATVDTSSDFTIPELAGCYRVVVYDLAGNLSRGILDIVPKLYILFTDESGNCMSGSFAEDVLDTYIETNYWRYDPSTGTFDGFDDGGKLTTVIYVGY